MAAAEREDVLAGLTAKGFRKEDRDHVFLLLEVDGKKTGIFTYVSRGRAYKTLGDDILTAMRKQLRLDTKSQLLELIECPMDHPKYVAYLRSKKIKV